MAKRKFAVQEDDVFDGVGTAVIPESQKETAGHIIEPNKQKGDILPNEMIEDSEPVDKTEAYKSTEEKAEVNLEMGKLDAHIIENKTTPIAQPGFIYRKKKEKRDVKKLILITPTMQETVTTLLKQTYNGMPFNMLVNDLLKEFVEKHGIKIEDDTF